ncbi:hypothetical protein QUF72_02350 [Desulfobacterales bacterium HSG2]|nr:hypothetical protein [Desulfobacterales bacterium HSG2]
MMKIMCEKMTILQAAAVLAVLLFLPGMVPAQEEMASAIRRYKDREASSGYYEEYEVMPRSRRIPVGVRGVGREVFPHSPSAAKVRIRTRLSDSHAGIKFYWNWRCEDCHVREAKDIHTVRANLTCRQCHGNEPIASIDHYRSPMNPIRRHAYVCAKCHEGASASFSTYVVHAPNPAMLSTKSSFPVLFYVFWVMVAIAVGTFVVFLPHTVMWGIRELFQKGEKR